MSDLSSSSGIDEPFTISPEKVQFLETRFCDSNDEEEGEENASPRACTIDQQILVNYPLLYVAPNGTISVLLQHNFLVEITIDKSIHVVCHDKFAMASNGRGTSSCILHRQARIFQQDAKVYSSFGDDKLAVFGSKGILFTMKHLQDVYLMSSSSSVCTLPRNTVEFPQLDFDFSLHLFYSDALTGQHMMASCQEMARQAHYRQENDGSMSVTVNGVIVHQAGNGDVQVISRPRHLHLSPTTGTVHLRTHFVDMAVQEADKSFVKCGVKRVHVSRSGMVVSDGKLITSMDHFGHIVSSH